MGRKTRIKYPTFDNPFNTKTDVPLRYFSTQEAFVRRTPYGGFKLYCEQGRYVPLFLAWDGFLYIYPAFKPEYELYVEAFLHDYAPHFPIEKAKRYIGRTHYEYIGNRELVTL